MAFGPTWRSRPTAGIRIGIGGLLMTCKHHTLYLSVCHFYARQQNFILKKIHF